jgi:hypothetical protein
LFVVEGPMSLGETKCTFNTVKPRITIRMQDAFLSV